MSKISYLAIVVLTLSSCGWGNKDTNQPLILTTISIPKKLINLGSYVKSDQKAARFPIVNTGNQPLVIETVSVDCHCTIVGWTKKPVMPKDTAFITAKYNNSVTGYFQKNIYVHANVQHSPIFLIFRGNVSLGY
ncbi:DUF1573 domain-containing protein [Mucilaginibacter sp. BJC16-A38]|uniref:DUF1573 domain-containing protein n=1 Tax=Mucilaginibacter phenanthrenivorans TaxID=1234842 RepID=UPI00215812D3|nr:DUF1573 domain-containing protein [Mucilaginibacter phenanthrenivorans]MCR8561070.1 DUF1573 domain-containing protein [Mucilaginibacter phenanthrenivorans]